MKRIFWNGFVSFGADLSGRFVRLADKDPDEEASAAVEDAEDAEDVEDSNKTAEKLLKKDLTEFSLADVEALNRPGNRKEMQHNPRLKRRFNDLMRSFVQMSLSQNRTVPPRVLQKLAGCGELMKHLDGPNTKEVDGFLNAERKALQEMLDKKSPESWGSIGTARIAAMFKRLSQEKDKSGVETETFELAREQLSERGAQLLRRQMEYGGHTSAAEANRVIETEGTEHLSATEKLLLITIYNAMPTGSSWLQAQTERFKDVQEHWKGIQGMAFQSMEEVLKNLETPNPDVDMVLIGDLINDLLQNGDRETRQGVQKALGEGATGRMKKLNEVIKRGQVVNFLVFAKESPVVSHEIMQQLKNIRDNTTLMTLGDGTAVLSGQAQVREDRLAEQRIQKQGEINALRGQHFAAAYEDLKRKEKEKYGNMSADERKKYTSSSERYEDELERENKARKDILDGLPGFVAGLKEDEGDWVKMLKQVLGEASGMRGDENYDEALVQKLQEAGTLLEQRAGEDQRDQPEVQEFLKKLREYEGACKGVEGMQDEIVDKNNEVRDARAVLQKELDEIGRDLYAVRDTQERLAEVMEFLQNPSEGAGELYKQHLRGVKQRLHSGRLQGVDLQVLQEEGVLEDALTNLGKETKENEVLRQRIGNLQKMLELMSMETDGVLYDAVQGIDAGTAQEVFAQAMKALGTGELLNALQLDHGENGVQMLSQVVQGGLLMHQDKILEALQKKVSDPAEQEQLVVLLDHWGGLGEKVINAETFRAVDRSVVQFHSEQEQLHNVVSGEVLKFKAVQERIMPEDKVEELMTGVSDFLGGNPKPTRAQLLEGVKALPTLQGEGNEELVSRLVDRLFLEGVVEEAERQHLGMHKVEQDGEGVWLPGQKQLSELKMQTGDARREIRKELDGLGGQFSALLGVDLGEEGGKKNFEKGFAGLLQAWNGGGKQTLEALRVDMQVLCGVLFSEPEGMPQFLEQYFAALDKAWKEVEKVFAELQEEGVEVFLANPERLESLRKVLILYGSHVDFEAGMLEGIRSGGEQSFYDTVNGTAFLKKWGYFEDETEDKTEFLKNAEQTQGEYKKVVEEYKTEVGKIRDMVLKDIDKMSDKDFLSFFTIGKSDMLNMLGQLNDFEAMLDGDFGKYLEGGYFRDWLERYHGGADVRVEALGELAMLEDLKLNIEEINKKIPGLRDWLQEAKEGRKGLERGGSKKIWFSVYDLYRIAKEFFEHRERNIKRKSDRAVGEMGHLIFGESGIGREFERMAHESEEQRVKEFEGHFGDHDTCDIKETLYGTNDQDEARAAINILLSRGALNWDDPLLWRALERLQRPNMVTFNEKELMGKNSDVIAQRVKQACEFIWHKEVFNQWEKSYEDSYNKAKGEWKREFSKYENLPEARDKMIVKMLQDWKRGDLKDTDPAKFESFLFQAFDQGKMNGTPDRRFYYLIIGATLRNPNGQTLLSRDVFMRANNELMARIPYMDFFGDKISWKKDGKIVPPNTPGATEPVNQWTPEDYDKWAEMLDDGSGNFDPSSSSAISANIDKFFFENIYMSDAARDRVSRMYRSCDKEGDHDDAWMFFYSWSEREIADALTVESSGKSKVTPDFYRQFLTGFPVYMERANEYIKEKDAEWGNESFWQEKRKKMLLDVGLRLKVAMMATQTLAGNFHGGSQTSPYAMEKAEFEKDSLYSPSVESSQKGINFFLKDVLQQAGDGGYEKFVGGEVDIDNYRGMVESAKWDNRKNLPKVKTIESLFSESESGRYFSNPDWIMNALEGYVAENGKRDGKW